MVGFRAGELLNETPLWGVAAALFAAMWAAAVLAMILRRHYERVQMAAHHQQHESEVLEGYIVSAVLGLLALLLGFTFSLALDRFDTRRALIRDEVNAIDTAYLHAQLLDQPHRARTTKLLLRYLDNRIAWAESAPGERQQTLLAVNDALITDLWAATAAAFDSIRGQYWSGDYLQVVARVTELDAQRKAARAARVPLEVFGVLIAYMITSAFVMGYVLRGQVGRFAAGFLLGLFTLALVLIIDINRPTGRANNENQQPMEELKAKLDATAPDAFDVWRGPRPGEVAAR